MGDIQQDPSMEEILASIKRVISEDSRGDAAAPARARRTPTDAASTEEDVLELDDPVTEETGLMSSNVAAASRERLSALSTLRRRSDLPAETGALDAVVRE